MVNIFKKFSLVYAFYEVCIQTSFCVEYLILKNFKIYNTVSLWLLILRILEF
jgi:hypothetical protein